MMAKGEPTIRFSHEDILGALDELPPETQELVLGALHNQHIARETAEKEGGLENSMIMLAISYERAAGQNASDSNIEGWHETLEQSATVLLSKFSERPEPEDPIHVSALRLAGA